MHYPQELKLQNKQIHVIKLTLLGFESPIMNKTHGNRQYDNNVKYSSETYLGVMFSPILNCNNQRSGEK